MAAAQVGQAVGGTSRAPIQYLFMIECVNPAASSLVRASACVPLSGNGPTRTRKTPSLDAGVTNTWKPFLVSASLMISAPGREVATTCQYWPAAGSFVMEASPAAGGPTAAGPRRGNWRRFDGCGRWRGLFGVRGGRLGCRGFCFRWFRFWWSSRRFLRGCGGIGTSWLRLRWRSFHSHGLAAVVSGLRGGGGRVTAHDVPHGEKYAQENHHDQKDTDELPVPKY